MASESHRHPESADARETAPQLLFSIDVRSWTRRGEAHASNTHVSEPREVAYFSRDGHRNVKFSDRSQLLSYVEPALHVNLGEGYDTFIPKSTTGAPVETIIQALNSIRFDFAEQADFVTYRNNLNKIGGSPYNKRDEWELDAVMVGGTVFLDVRHTDDQPRNDDHKRFMYYGYRFEALCTGTENEPVNANSEFCSISRIRIANHRILISCEIDCTLGDPSITENALRNYIELKTMRCVRNDRDISNMYRYRYQKYWLQSYLAGVRNISLGMRSDDGEVLEVRRLNTHELHREARTYLQSHGVRWFWDPYVCINFVDYVLSYVRRACATAAGSTVRVRYDPKAGTITGTYAPQSEVQLRTRVLDKLKESRPEEPAT